METLFSGCIMGGAIGDASLVVEPQGRTVTVAGDQSHRHVCGARLDFDVWLMTAGDSSRRRGPFVGALFGDALEQFE